MGLTALALSGNMAAGMAEAEQQGPLALGQKFLKYTIRERIGRGGHAWVYHGHDPFLDNDVAIKILHRHGGVTADMLRRGQAEARLLFRLKHPNIVEVLDAGVSDAGLLYIVMERLQGTSLRELLRRRGRLPPEEAVALCAELTRGLAAAHAFGAIHRDLKPENVFILPDGRPKILDFGIAKVVDAVGMTTEKDVLHGTILYISPEQLEGQRATPRSDLYALGLVFFELLYGRHPLLLKKSDPTVRELSLMHIGYQPPRLDELDPTIPRHLARLVERLLLKSPAQRMPSTEALGEALAQCAERLAGARAPGGGGTAGTTERVVVHGDTERIPVSALPDRRTVSDPMTRAELERGPVSAPPFAERATPGPAAQARAPFAPVHDEPHRAPFAPVHDEPHRAPFAPVHDEPHRTPFAPVHGDRGARTPFAPVHDEPHRTPFAPVHGDQDGARVSAVPAARRSEPEVALAAHGRPTVAPLARDAAGTRTPPWPPARRRAARALGAGAVVGVALGALFVAFRASRQPRSAGGFETPPAPVAAARQAAPAGGPNHSSSISAARALPSAMPPSIAPTASATPPSIAPVMTARTPPSIAPAASTTPTPPSVARLTTARTPAPTPVPPATASRPAARTATGVGRHASPPSARSSAPIAPAPREVESNAPRRDEVPAERQVWIE